MKTPIHCKWNDFVARWQERECYGAEKYLHWRSQVERFEALAEHAGLLSVGGMKILDISSGMGLWAYCLTCQKHTVFTTENYCRETEIYQDALRTLKLPEAIPHAYPLKKFIPLPEYIGSFDIITSIACPPMSFWCEDECKRFITDAFSLCRIRISGSS